jgi:hypothetical protein
MRIVLLLALLAGCSSSSSTSGASDLAAPPDLTMACMMGATGDATLASDCRVSLCHPTSNDYESISSIGPVAQPIAHLLFEVNGVFALRSYVAADLRAFDADVASNGKHYAANDALAGSSVTATITALTAPVTTPCDGIPHGTATATLIEYDQSTGMATGTGRATMTVSF